MARIVFLNKQGVRQLLRSPEVLDDLAARAQKIEAAANAEAGEPDAFEWDAEIGPNRARASVRTTSLEGMKAEAHNRTLTRAVDAGR